MRKKNHPVCFVLVVCLLISALYYKGAFDPAAEDETAENSTESVVSADDGAINTVAADGNVKSTGTGAGHGADGLKTQEETESGEVTEHSSDKETEHVHTGFKTVKESEIPATCTKKGSYEEVVYCSCGEEISREKKETKALGHNYVEGICKKCSAEDPDYVKVYNSKEIVESLCENLVTDTGTFESYLGNGETISVFAEEQSDAFSLRTAVWYNLWNHNVQSVTFNIRSLSEDIDTLYFKAGGETGSSGTMMVEIYLDRIPDEEPADYSVAIECSTVPTDIAVKIHDAASMAIRVTNRSDNENRIVFFDFSSVELS